MDNGHLVMSTVSEHYSKMRNTRIFAICIKKYLTVENTTDYIAFNSTRRLKLYLQEEKNYRHLRIRVSTTTPNALVRRIYL